MKIRGNTVGTTMPRPDWNQADPKKADYIFNKPDIPQVVAEELKKQGAYTGGDLSLGSHTLRAENVIAAKVNGDDVNGSRGYFEDIQTTNVFTEDIEAGNGIETQHLIAYDRIELDSGGEGAYITGMDNENGCAVLEFYGNAGDEPTILRHVAPGVGEDDAATKGQLDTAVGDIETALDSILSIQWELMGCISFTIGGKRYYADANGQTWAEWCDSAYNTDGYYVDGEDVCTEVGDRVADEECAVPVVATDVIDEGYAYTNNY